MIVGVGVDLCQVSRFEEAIADPKFLPRIFTPAEIESLGKAESIAGRWAAKEAILKAVGRKVPWLHIEITADEHGKPTARFIEEPELAKYRLHLSISHDHGMAIAFAILEAH